MDDTQRSAAASPAVKVQFRQHPAQTDPLSLNGPMLSEAKRRM